MLSLEKIAGLHEYSVRKVTMAIQNGGRQNFKIFDTRY